MSRKSRSSLGASPNLLASTTFALLAMVGALLSGCAAGDVPVHPMNVMVDQGQLTYYVNEEVVGTSTFEWRADGSFTNTATVTIAGQTLPLSTNIAVDAAGLWTSVTMTTPMGPARVKRSGASAEVHIGQEVKSVALKPGALIMEDMSPALMSQAIIAYNHEEGGKQEFPVLFLPGIAIEGSLEYLGTFQRFVGGEPQKFRKYRYEMPPIYNVIVVVDERNRVCFAEYPAQHGVFVRNGYEGLRVGDASLALLSAPEHKVVEEKGLAAPMRDGVELATDIYRPDTERPSPVIVVRTPYKKEMVELTARYYARRGYVFAVQDVRGRFSSPGEWRPYVHEADDGYDTIEWLAAQPWSNGKVGVMGGSYSAWAGWWAASRRPPHLVTMISSVSPPEPYFNSPHEYGALMLAPTLWWSQVVAGEATADISGLAIRESLDILNSDKLKHLPAVDLDEIVLGERDAYWRECVAHPDYDEHWQRLAFMRAMADFPIPVYHQSGWFDGDGLGAKLNYLGMVGHGHDNQKLVIGPWGHSATDHRFGSDGVDWGPRALVDLQTSYLRWMDRWLKGVENGIEAEPSVSLFVMGPNDWIYADSYPPGQAALTKFYLASEGDGAGADGNGVLTERAPTSEAAATDTYTYDPADPTPMNPEGRRDILVYRTAPMTEPLTIVGPMSAVLYAATSARDTDWVMQLVKEDARGKVLRLAHGIIRARYRESLARPKLLEPGAANEYRLDLWHTAVMVARGERLVLIISSALFPKFSRNLNTGGHNEMEAECVVARQTVYHDREHPSHLLLPVIAGNRFGAR